MEIKYNIIPHAFIFVTTQCNLKCKYCQPGGENYLKGNYTLNQQLTFNISKILKELNISRIRLSGGEPTTVIWLGELMKHLNLLGFSKLRISTNGYFLHKYISQLSNFRVHLSIDSLFNQKPSINTDKCLSYSQIHELSNFLHSNKIDTRINTVVTKENIGEIKSIVEFCRMYNFGLKLLGLEYWNVFDKSYVQKNYVDWDELSHTVFNGLKPIREMKAPGNIGIGMAEYVIAGTEIRVRFYDGWGAKYVKQCLECKYFPCSSGIYGLNIFADNFVSLCRFRNIAGEWLDESDDYMVLKEKIISVLNSLQVSNLISQNKISTYGKSKFISAPKSVNRN